jgi:hypothetical protein
MDCVCPVAGNTGADHVSPPCITTGRCRVVGRADRSQGVCQMSRGGFSHPTESCYIGETDDLTVLSPFCRRPCSRCRSIRLGRGLSAVRPVSTCASHGQGRFARGLDPSKMGEPEETVTGVHRLVRSARNRRTSHSLRTCISGDRGHLSGTRRSPAAHSRPPPELSLMIRPSVQSRQYPARILPKCHLTVSVSVAVALFVVGLVESVRVTLTL